MSLKYKISGTTLPVVTVELEPGIKVYSESGGMSWMSGNVDMDTNTGGGLG
ncbi:MAG: AIM24 family protein, partial [Chloroflexi bacterium]|nr:AIM24 family protein [Chloroflexota bacterium]